MKKTLFITILLSLAIIVVSLVIWTDKKNETHPIVNNTATTTEVVTELPPIPEGFKEIVLDSGLRFGIPEGWVDSTTESDIERESLYTYKTNDYIKKVMVETKGDYGDDPWIVESGSLLNIEFSGNKIDNDHINYINDYHNSKCKIDIENKCYILNISDTWSVRKINENSPVYEIIQYVYIAGKIIDNRAVSFSLYPPQNANPTETEKLFSQILETVSVVESK